MPRIRHRAIFAVVIAYALFCWVVVFMRPYGLHWSPDCYAKYLAVKSIRYDHGIRSDVPYLGRDIDPWMQAIPIGESFFDVRMGEIHISWPELFPILVFPFFKILGFYGLFVVPIVAGCISVYLTGRIAELLRPRSGWLAALLTATATPVVFYSTLFWEHTPALALMMLATLCFVRFMRGESLRFVALGSACVGLASAGLRTDANLFFAGAVGAFFLVERGRQRILVPAIAVLGFLLGALPAVLLNWTTNGKFLAANTGKNTPPPSLGYLREAGLGVLTHFFAGRPVPSIFAWIVILAAVSLIAGHYLPSRFRAAVVVPAAAALTIGSVLCLVDAYRSDSQSFYGYLAMSPLVAAAYMLPSMKAPTTESRAAVFILVAASIYSFLNLTALTLAYPYGWAADGNLEWGPRYWLPLFPMLVIVAVVNFDDMMRAARNASRRPFQLAALALVLVSAAFEVQGLRQATRLIGTVYDARATLLRQEDTPLLTDMFFTSAVSGDQFYRRPSFYVSVGSPAVFADWFPRAAEHGLTHFDLATYGDIVSHPFLHMPLRGWRLDVTGYDKTGHVIQVAHVRAVRTSEP